MKLQKECMGVGSRLEFFLNKIGIYEKQGCNCKAFALELDRQGKEWCQKHFNAIIRELHNRSKEFGYPWNNYVAQIMLKAAIRLADR